MAEPTKQTTTENLSEQRKKFFVELMKGTLKITDQTMLTNYIKAFTFETNVDMQTKLMELFNEYLQGLTVNKEGILKYKVFGSSKDPLLIDLRNYNNFRSTLSTAIKYKDSLTQKPCADDLLSPSKSYFMSKNDFLFSDKISSIETDSVPGLIINEFQPDKIVYWSNLAAGVANSLKNLALPNGTLPKEFDIFEKTLTFAGQKFAAQSSNSLMSLASVKPQTLYGKYRSINQEFDPLMLVKKLFSQRKMVKYI